MLWRGYSQQIFRGQAPGPPLDSFHPQPCHRNLKNHAKTTLRPLVCLCQLCIYTEIYFCSILKISSTWSWKCCFIVRDGLKYEKSKRESVIQGYYGGASWYPVSSSLSKVNSLYWVIRFTEEYYGFQHQMKCRSKTYFYNLPPHPAKTSKLLNLRISLLGLFAPSFPFEIALFSSWKSFALPFPFPLPWNYRWIYLSHESYKAIRLPKNEVLKWTRPRGLQST